MRRLGVLMIAAALAGCASHRPVPPARPVASTGAPILAVPPGLALAPSVQQQFNAAVSQLQSGDLRGANRGFTDVLKASPDFYPAETGLGYVALANKQYRQASAHFASALKTGSQYLPALEGQVDAELADGDDLGAIAAIEQLLAVDARREDLRSRLDVLRLRVVQSELEAAAKARAAGHLDEAQRILERALASSPSSSVLTRELARIELQRAALGEAETHARRAIELDAGDAEAVALLGDVLDVEGRTREAVQAYARAIAIDPQPAWREKHDALVARADLEALPAEYRSIGSAPSVTRAQVAAMVGIELKPVIDRAPKRATDVITDLRNHWAAPWILPVSQAGVMDVLPNHTFQPNAVVRRTELARVVSQVLNLLAARRPVDIAAWRDARPHFADVSSANASYRAIALATASGAMKADDDSRFQPLQPASGADLTAAVARLRQLAGR